MDVKGTLKAVTLELRRELDGRYDAQGTWHPGDLERRLASIGVWRDREPKPLDELPRLAPDDREARRLVDAFLESQREAGRSREDAIAEFVRDAAYTWANRLLALRCMEARGLIDEVILQKDAYGGRSLQHNRLARKQPERCAGEDEGLFATLSDEFARRAEELPLLFDPRAPEVALRPSVAALKRCVSLLSGTSAVKGQEAATDDVFTAPDALGWTYQYWDTEEKDRVFETVRTKKGFKIEGADIIPATCIYTEPYMVRFLVQNSLGAIWMGMRPDSGLADKWEYFVRGGDRAPVSKKPVAEITFLDPACGSGHFLIEAFELFYTMYLEEGALTEPADICASILECNLYGIDIDKRAVQIAALALVMKAKEKAADFVPGRVNLVGTNIRLPSGTEHLEAFLQKHPEDAPLEPALLSIFEGLAHADELGSLLQIEEPVEKELRALSEKYEAAGSPMEQQALWPQFQKSVQGKLPIGVATYGQWKQGALARLREHFDAEAHEIDLGAAFFGEAAGKGMSLVDLLLRRYDVVAANPPYMGSKNMGPLVRKFVERHFAPGKRDLYAAFILRCLQLATDGGRVAMVTQQSWMFLRSFADLRALNEEKPKKALRAFGGVLRKTRIEEIAHLGEHAFHDSAAAGAFVALFVLAKVQPSAEHRVTAFRLVAPKSPEEKDYLLRTAPPSVVHRTEQARFMSLDRSPLAYWLSASLLSLFEKYQPIRAISYVRQGICTTDNERFVRGIWEIPTGAHRRWFLFAKGGGTRRWAGFDRYMVDWEHNGVRVKTFQEDTPGAIHWSGRMPDQSYFFRPGWTFSRVGRGTLGARALREKALFCDTSPAAIAFEQRDHERIGFWLNTRLLTFLLRALTQSLDCREGYVQRLPLPEVPPGDLAARMVGLPLVLSRRLVETDILDIAFDASSPKAELSGQRTLGIEAFYLAIEGLRERAACAAVGLTSADVETLTNDLGTPAGWFPLVVGYDAAPDLPPQLNVPAEVLDALAREERRILHAEVLADLKRRLRTAYEAGPGGDPNTEDEGAASGNDDEDDQDDSELTVSGARIPIPVDTFLEELSQKLEIHPISVYWLLRELREKEGIVSNREFRRLVEDYLTVTVLRLLGHQWPREVEGHETAPAWADKNGIIPLTEGTREPSLISRVRARVGEDFGAGRAGAVEREFEAITGKPLVAWLASGFFKRHISQFRKRPIAWQLTSTTASNTKRSGRGAAQTAPVFSCLLYYHRLDADLLPKLKTQYVGPLRTSLQTELGALEKMSNRSADQDARRVELEGKLEELKAFDQRLEQALTLGFASPSLDALVAKEPLDKWCSRDGRAPGPATRDAFLAQECRYDPDLNDGVRVNVAPLQRAGLLAIDVLAMKDLERAIVDRAKWRADERRWCRDGKLPQPGWWPVAPTAIDVPAIPAPLPAMDAAQEAMLFVWALLHAAGGSLPRMDVARAFALRCHPRLLWKFAPSDLQLKVSGWADQVGQRTVAAGLLASVLADLASRDIVRLTTEKASRSVVTIGPEMPTEDEVDAWFRFEARLALRVLSSLQPEQVQEIEQGIMGDDRKLLAAEVA